MCTALKKNPHDFQNNKNQTKLEHSWPQSNSFLWVQEEKKKHMLTTQNFKQFVLPLFIPKGFFRIEKQIEVTYLNRWNGNCAGKISSQQDRPLSGFGAFFCSQFLHFIVKGI